MRPKRAFEVKQKTFFINFKGISVAKNCLKPESAPLNQTKKLKLKSMSVIWWISIILKELTLGYFLNKYCVHDWLKEVPFKQQY